MKLTYLRSGINCTISPLNNAPRPSPPAAQCSTVPPAKWPPQRMSVTPRASGKVSPSHSLMTGSGRMIHCRSAACRWMGAPPKARLFGRAQDERALADGKFRHRPDPDQAGLVLLIAIEVAARERFEGGPPLAAGRNELTLVLTDRT